MILLKQLKDYYQRKKDIKRLSQCMKHLEQIAIIKNESGISALEETELIKEIKESIKNENQPLRP